MSLVSRKRPLTLLAFSAASIALAALTGLSFALWWRYGERMLVTLVENGIAWCY